MKMTTVEKRFVNGQARTAAVAREVMALLEQIPVAEGWRLLDVGCGVGSAACAIAQRWGVEAVAVDIDPEQIVAANAATSLPNVRFLAMDATALDFPDDEFDVVVSSMATHHIRQWDRALSEMARVLRPGGYLAYIDFMFPHWLARAGRVLGPLMTLPSAKAFDSFAARTGLAKTYHRRSGVRLHTICQKSG